MLQIIIFTMVGNCYDSNFGWMLVLLMASFLTSKEPAISFDNLNHLFNFFMHGFLIVGRHKDSKCANYSNAFPQLFKRDFKLNKLYY